ncbi:MAG: hypothetical protein IKH18_10120 [Clostridia bacterium]|nr:hypothetical protein [Clostridia bacterium]
MDATVIFLKELKRKGIIRDVDKARSELSVEVIPLKVPKDLFIRDAITGLGTIMKEDLENHYYITSVKMGMFSNILTYAIIVRNEETAEITAYAREGLIKQNLAEKTVKKLKEVLLTG